MAISALVNIVVVALGLTVVWAEHGASWRLYVAPFSALWLALSGGNVMVYWARLQINSPKTFARRLSLAIFFEVNLFGSAVALAAALLQLLPWPEIRFAYSFLFPTSVAALAMVHRSLTSLKDRRVPV